MIKLDQERGTRIRNEENVPLLSFLETQKVVLLVVEETEMLDELNHLEIGANATRKNGRYLKADGI